MNQNFVTDKNLDVKVKLPKKNVKTRRRIKQTKNSSKSQPEHQATKQQENERKNQNLMIYKNLTLCLFVSKYETALGTKQHAIPPRTSGRTQERPWL